MKMRSLLQHGTLGRVKIIQSLYLIGIHKKGQARLKYQLSIEERLKH